jgi:hypothetical protein
MLKKRDKLTIPPLLVTYVDFRSIVHSDICKVYNNLHILLK